MRLPLGLCVLLLIALWASDASAFFYSARKRPTARGVFESRETRRSSEKSSVTIPAPSASLRAVASPGALDLVIAHYAEDTIAHTVDWWSGFLSIGKVDKLKPRVFIFCQNPNVSSTEPFERLLKYGGRVTILENVGREGHAFLTYITENYDKLPDHVLFSQDIAMDFKLWHRFQNMFEPKTGFLPLAWVGYQDCSDPFLPPGLMHQMYALLTRSLCPPQGFTAAYNGQFVVSRKRLQSVTWWTYRHLLELLAAPQDHWIHQTHTNDYYKRPDNPFFGHVLERAWSLAFGCYESWRAGNCWECDEVRQMQDCGSGACQCLDMD